MARKRKATTCEACGFESWHGRVCRECLRYWGGPASNVLAAVALRRRLDGCHTLEHVGGVLGELCDVLVSDWPGVSLPRLLYGSAVPIAAADQAVRELQQGELFGRHS